MRNGESPGSRRAPAAMRLGFLILLLGLVLDLGYHAAATFGGGAVSHAGPVATAVHVIVLLGMTTTFAGVLQVAFRPHKAVDRKEKQQ